MKAIFESIWGECIIVHLAARMPRVFLNVNEEIGETFLNKRFSEMKVVNG